MNPAEWAIPGLMPPEAPNWMMQNYTPEDGSLKMCVWCGKDSDTVTYALSAGAHRRLLKDPNYEFWYSQYLEEKKALWAVFLSKEEALPDDAYVPYVKRCRWKKPRPVTERCDIEDADKRYWILTLPKGTLLPGVNELQISVNGTIHHYVLNTPAYIEHFPYDSMNHFKKDDDASL